MGMTVIRYHYCGKVSKDLANPFARIRIFGMNGISAPKGFSGRPTVIATSKPPVKTGNFNHSTAEPAAPEIFLCVNFLVYPKFLTMWIKK